MISDRIPLPRPEYPRPQFSRSEWLNLNGEWTFEFDHGKSGQEAGRALYTSRGFDSSILVPFCPESRLSGVGYTDFIECLWYHRSFTIPESWNGKTIHLHFGAVDYESEVFVDGEPAGRHFGGAVSFSIDITDRVEVGRSHELVLRVFDDTRSQVQPAGKQSIIYRSRGCRYTRVTGIWQTVWLEPIDPRGLRDIHLVPDLDAGRIQIYPRLFSNRRADSLRAALLADGKVVAEAESSASPGTALSLDIPGGGRPWSIDDPFLYDLEITVLGRDGDPLDAVKSYAGLRKVHIEDNRVFLNNEPLYQRLVLDQGYYPEGIWTAPDDLALKTDIELAQAAGFNGARLHQKVFEERYHYWADRLGYITWAETPSWNCDVNNNVAARNFLSEWREVLLRDRNHPSIIAWTPFNETKDISNPPQHRRVHIDAYELAKALDPTRPVNDSSGYIHVRTDFWTVHVYEQDPKALKEKLTPDEKRGVFRNIPMKEPPYAGQPYVVDEFGGIMWVPPDRDRFAKDSWGYGNAPRTEEEFFTRLEGLVEAILAFPHVCGYCYTQLTDVEQEENGVYTYDRSEKFDTARFAAIFSRLPDWFCTSNS